VCRISTQADDNKSICFGDMIWGSYLQRKDFSLIGALDMDFESKRETQIYFSEFVCASLAAAWPALFRI
jgi:hypothetical protein